MQFSFIPISSKSDEELLVSYRQTKDIELVSELFMRYNHLIYGVCLKYLKNASDSEDSTMHLYEVMKEKLQSHKIDNLGGWIHVTAKNYCLMLLRAEKSKENQQKIFESDMESGFSMHHDNTAIPETTMRQLNICLDRLSIEQKKCIELFYFSKKCYREVANLTGYELKKVKSNLQNAKRNLKICLEGGSSG